MAVYSMILYIKVAFVLFLFSNIKKQDVLPADLVDTVNKVVTPRVVLPGTESWSIQNDTQEMTTMVGILWKKSLISLRFSHRETHIKAEQFSKIWYLCRWHIKRKVIWQMTKLWIFEYSCNLFLLIFEVQNWDCQTGQRQLLEKNKHYIIFQKFVISSHIK